MQQQQFFLDFTLVMGKQVITRSQGRNLGTVTSAWVDPQTLEVVSIDVEDKKAVRGARIANIPLSRLTQIGDVVLVTDDTSLYEPPMDGRFGYYILQGMEVRTRSGEFLGKVSFLRRGAALRDLISYNTGRSYQMRDCLFRAEHTTVGGDCVHFPSSLVWVHSTPAGSRLQLFS